MRQRGDGAASESPARRDARTGVGRGAVGGLVDAAVLQRAGDLRASRQAGRDLFALAAIISLLDQTVGLGRANILGGAGQKIVAVRSRRENSGS